ncbi:MAG: ROK family transcriptional regulator [candidate division KSB1 bacterium]
MNLRRKKKTLSVQTEDAWLRSNVQGRQVLNLIREHDSISGADLATRTGMRPAAIARIVKELAAKALISNSSAGESSAHRGKKPELWSVIKPARYAVGIAVEIGEIAAVVLDLGGNLVGRNIYKRAVVSNFSEAVGHIREAIENILMESGIARERIAGLGLAVSGVVDPRRGLICLTEVFSQRNIPLLEHLQPHYAFPLVVENNANAAALGAKWLGKNNGSANYLTVLVKIDRNVGGMGVGLVLNHELYRGAAHCAGELNIRLPMLGDLLRSLRPQFDKGVVLRDYKDAIEVLDIAMLIDAARQNDKIALAFFDALGHIIGKSIAKSVALINPEKIVLVGDIAEVGKHILEPLRAAITPEILNLAAEALELEASPYGRDAVAMGAAALVWNDFFKLPEGMRSTLMPAR